MALQADFGRIAHILRRYRMNRRMRIMAARAGKLEARAQGVRLSRKRMAVAGACMNHHVLACTLLVVARLAVFLDQTRENEIILSGMRVVAGQAFALGCGHMHVLLRHGIGCMALKAESGNRGNEHAGIVRCMRIVAGRAHSGGNRRVQGFLLDHGFIVALKTKIRDLADKQLGIGTSVRIMAGNAHPAGNRWVHRLLFHHAFVVAIKTQTRHFSSQ